MSGVYLATVREGAGADVEWPALSRRAGKGMQPEVRAGLSSLALPRGARPSGFNRAGDAQWRRQE